MPSSRTAPASYLLLSLVALFWAGNVVFGRAVLDEVPPLGLNFWRWIGALAILLPFSWRALVRERAVLRRDWKILAALGLFGVTAFNSFGYTALQTTTAINAALVNAAIPVMVMAITITAFRDPVAARQVAGLAVSLFGTVVILIRGDAAVLYALDVVRGDLWMAAAALSCAVYTVLLRFRPPELDGVALLAAVTAFGLVPMVPIYLAETVLVSPMPITTASVGMVAYAALFPSALAYVFWNRGMAVVGPARGALFIHLMPVFTAALAIALLGEALRPYHVVGLILIVGGLYCATSRTPIAGS